MNPKRTMSQALHSVNLSAEAAAFVAAGAAGNVVASTPSPELAPDSRASLPLVATATAAPKSRALAFSHSPLPAERRAPVSMTFRHWPGKPESRGTPGWGSVRGSRSLLLIGCRGRTRRVGGRRQRPPMTLRVFAHNLIDAITPVAVVLFRQFP